LRNPSHSYQMKKTYLILLLFSVCFCCCAGRPVNAKGSKRKKKIQADWQVVIIPSPKSIAGRVGYVEVFPHGNDLNSANFAVMTPKGKRISAKLLWKAPGESMKILFNATSNAKSYSILFGKKISPMKPKWEARAGLILETRKRATGNANNWKEAQKVIAKSTTVEGRSMVNKIFHGINPHGKSFNLIAYYKGYLKIKKSGKYKFAIAADDAVFLFIDGKKITDWPGWHSPWAGVRGKFAGKIPLKKGIHKIEYYNIQNEYGMKMVCGWQPPGKKYLEVIPPESFVPFRNYTVDKLKFKNKGVPAWFKWERKSHLMVNGKSLISMNFKVINPLKSSKCKWYFDDSTTASGTQVSHLFFSPGLRKIKLEIKNKHGKLLGAVENFVKVAPRWTQREEWPKSIYKDYRKKIKTIDLSKLPVCDISNLVDILGIIDNRKLLAKVGKVCLNRKKEFADNPKLFYKLSQCYIHYSIREYDLAEQTYKATLEFAGKDEKLVAKTKLYYAALKIHNYGKCDDGIKFLKEVDEKHLSSFEKRKKQIWLADGYMTKGDMDTVEKIYSELPDVVDKKKSSNTIKNEARVLNALDFLRRGAYDDAEKMVWQVEWEYPYEAMNSHTGLVMTKVFIKRKEYNYALWRCMRMMNAAKNSRQMSNIMLTLIEIYHLTGNKKEAVELSDKLLKEFPYSEAAAILKETKM
jgi:Fe-S cluster biosynthesis and repair protein YggX